MTFSSGRRARDVTLSLPSFLGITLTHKSYIRTNNNSIVFEASLTSFSVFLSGRISLAHYLARNELKLGFEKPIAVKKNEPTRKYTHSESVGRGIVMCVYV